MTYWIKPIDDFINYKFINQWISIKTIRIYNQLFKKLIITSYLNFSDLSTFSESNLKQFLWENLIKYKWGSETYNKYRKNLKSFCNYLVKSDLLQSNPCTNIDLRKRKIILKKSIDKLQIIELKKTIDSCFNTSDFYDIRNKTLLYMYLLTWCRLYELINMKFDDINFLNQTIFINQWKWSKDRIIPLLFNLSDLLIKYQLQLKKLNYSSEYLFFTKNKMQLTHRDIYMIFHKINSQINFKITPHMLRHTFATELVRKNINVYNVSKILWHSDIKTTQIYLWIDINSVISDLNSKTLF